MAYFYNEVQQGSSKPRGKVASPHTHVVVEPKTLYILDLRLVRLICIIDANGSHTRDEKIPEQ